jgi:hypothetical protein
MDRYLHCKYLACLRLGGREGVRSDMSEVRAQSQADVAAVIAANNGYHAALSALDMAAMENVWVHEDYVSISGGPRNAAPLTG